MPSRPRLMRPLFSVMHSPRLTNRNGVLTRIAPPRTAIGTPSQPSSAMISHAHSSRGAEAGFGLGRGDQAGLARLENRPLSVERFARQDREERDSLENKH